MVKAKADRPATELEEVARRILDALASCSDRNLVQGPPEDALIDGTFDLTSVARELQAKGYWPHRSA